METCEIDSWCPSVSSTSLQGLELETFQPSSALLRLQASPVNASSTSRNYSPVERRKIATDIASLLPLLNAHPAPLAADSKWRKYC